MWYDGPRALRFSFLWGRGEDREKTKDTKNVRGTDALTNRAEDEICLRGRFRMCSVAEGRLGAWITGINAEPGRPPPPLPPRSSPLTKGGSRGMPGPRNFFFFFSFGPNFFYLHPPLCLLARGIVIRAPALSLASAPVKRGWFEGECVATFWVGRIRGRGEGSYDRPFASVGHHHRRSRRGKQLSDQRWRCDRGISVTAAAG